MKTFVQLAATAPKSLTKAELNLLGKIDVTLFPVVETPANRVNPFSGATHTLEPLAASLYDFITARDMGNRIAAGTVAQSTWDRARYLFLKLWPEFYWDMID